MKKCSKPAVSNERKSILATLLAVSVSLIVCAFASLSARGATDSKARTVKFVEYVESDESRLAYVTTAYEPNAGTEIEMEFAFTRADLGLKTYVFGEYGTGGARFQFSYGPDNCLFGFGGQNNYDNTISNFTYNTARHVVKYVTNEGFYLDGTKVVANNGADLVTWEGESKRLLLGACNGTSVNTNYIAPLRIYSCKIWDHGKLARDFRPVLVNTSTVRLYDAAWRTFYSNSNKDGGALIASTTEVEVETDYQRASYIESDTNRYAYIDTEYVPNANTQIEVSFAFTTNLETKTYVFGSYGADSKGRFQFSYGPSTAGCFLGYGGTYTNSYVLPYENYYNTDRHVVKYVPGSGFYFDGKLLAPPGVNLTTWTGTSTNLFLGAVAPYNNTVNYANNAPIRIYSCKIWETNTTEHTLTLVRDLVPMQRTSDQKNGLYDNVTKKFYTYYYNSDGRGAEFNAAFPPPGLILLLR